MTSNTLTYNPALQGKEGWIDDARYDDKDIENISDPQRGKTVTPKVAIPSPFAQFDLVKNAFKHIAATKDLKYDGVKAGKMDERLVSYALDIGQLFFHFDERKDKLKIIEWNKDRVFDMQYGMVAEPTHRLIAQTLKMFMEQDGKSYNFQDMQNLYFLKYEDDIIGCTSPVTLFMATPNAIRKQYDIVVETGINLFSKIRPLYEREEKYIKFLNLIFSAYPELREKLPEVHDYLIKCKDNLPAHVAKEISDNYGDIKAVDVTMQSHYAEKYENDYAPVENVNILGVPLHQVHQKDVKKAVQESDFVIKATLTEEGVQLPLALQNKLNAPANDPYIYIDKAWDDAVNSVPMFGSPNLNSRELPQSGGIMYPWVSTNDFLETSIIKIQDSPLFNDDNFFDGNVQMKKGLKNYGYLLPLKPLFFKYFTANDLTTMVFGNKKMIDMEVGKADDGREIVDVTLRIPIKKPGKFVTFKRTYETGREIFDTENNIGSVKPVAFSLSIFPFVSKARHKVMLIDRSFRDENIEGSMTYNITSKFYRKQNGANEEIKIDEPRQRDRKEESARTAFFYNVDNDFDYIQFEFKQEGASIGDNAVLVPKWPLPITGSAQFTFAVDFGTTNTHVEYMKDDEQPQPLELKTNINPCLVATLYKKDEDNPNSTVLLDNLNNILFLPKEIGGKYKFPQRTVLSENDKLDELAIDKIVALGDANIPFIYEKGPIGNNNKLVPNLKWSTTEAAGKQVEAFMTELMELMYTKVLLDGGKPEKTKFVWFYPLSMYSGDVTAYSRGWQAVFEKTFGVEADSENFVKMPESVAPYFYYVNNPKTKSSNATVASIDIGGGTSDVVVYNNKDLEGNRVKIPEFLTSFRFAANTLFGDAFSKPNSDDNPMVNKYVEHFWKLFEQDRRKYKDLKASLKNIADRKRSDDINTFLFSVADSEAAAGNKVFNYNQLLNEDRTRKVIFIYFYASIVYYVVKVMKHLGMPNPRHIMFSGTGSKVLNIVGTKEELSQFTKYLIKEIYGDKYVDSEFSVIMEENEPKQITCKGALLQMEKEKDLEYELKSINKLNDKIDGGYEEKSLKVNYSMIPAKDELTYGDVTNNVEIKHQIVDAVKEWNNLFIKFFEDKKLDKRFNVDGAAWALFKENVNKDLDHYLNEGWDFNTRTTSKSSAIVDTDVVEDSVFFYPIIGSIRYNLIENLK